MFHLFKMPGDDLHVVYDAERIIVLAVMKEESKARRLRNLLNDPMVFLAQIRPDSAIPQKTVAVLNTLRTLTENERLFLAGKRFDNDDFDRMIIGSLQQRNMLDRYGDQTVEGQMIANIVRSQQELVDGG